MDYHLYIFFGILASILFFIGLYDYGFTKQKVAAIPIIFSLLLSIILIGTTYSLDPSIIAGWEQDAIAIFWFAIFLISFILLFVISLSKLNPGAYND